MCLITLTTDFGEGSPYVAEMRGVILAINRSARVIDLTHSIPAQDVAAGARVLDRVTRQFPPDTIHIAVVDPGVGSARRILYLENTIGRFIAPDNGTLSILAGADSAHKIVSIQNPEHWAERVCHTFHGRDIMAPVAARLSLGLKPEQLGPPQRGLVRLELSEARTVGQQIEGEVVEIDSFGNLITNITAVMLDSVPRDETVNIHCDGHQTAGIFSTYSQQPEMTLIALVGSSDRLEIAIVNESAAAMLAIPTGTLVVVSW